MASPNVFQTSFSSPYTYLSDAPTTSLASDFNTMSNPISDSQANGYSPTYTVPDGVASLLSKVTGRTTTLLTSTIQNANSASSVASSNGAAATVATSPNTSAAASRTSTSGSGSGSGSSQTVTSALSEQTTGGVDSSGSSTGTSTNASTTSAIANDGTTVAKSTATGGLSTGTKAAIAVPIVVLALVALVIAVMLIRRRKRKRGEKGLPAEKVPLAAQKKRWTRHLRIFSFDTELLMGGRFSSTNSVRSRGTNSTRSGASSQNSQAPSVHTVDEVAPPYRDAISTAQPLSIGQVMAGTGAVGVARAASNATANTANTAGTMGTAPPPYGARDSRAMTPGTPSTIGRRNPFSDSAPVSPVEASPFNDPPNHSPAISRNSSVYHTERDDSSAYGGGSEAASIREATLARNASVMSGGRIINHVNKI